jgi:hypothetical protein
MFIYISSSSSSQDVLTYPEDVLTINYVVSGIEPLCSYWN